MFSLLSELLRLNKLVRLKASVKMKLILVPVALALCMAGFHVALVNMTHDKHHRQNRNGVPFKSQESTQHQALGQESEENTRENQQSSSQQGQLDNTQEASQRGKLSQQTVHTNGASPENTAGTGNNPNTQQNNESKNVMENTAESTPENGVLGKQESDVIKTATDKNKAPQVTDPPPSGDGEKQQNPEQQRSQSDSLIKNRLRTDSAGTLPEDSDTPQTADGEEGAHSPSQGGTQDQAGASGYRKAESTSVNGNTDRQADTEPNGLGDSTHRGASEESAPVPDTVIPSEHLEPLGPPVTDDNHPSSETLTTTTPSPPVIPPPPLQDTAHPPAPLQDTEHSPPPEEQTHTSQDQQDNQPPPSSHAAPDDLIHNNVQEGSSDINPQGSSLEIHHQGSSSDINPEGSSSDLNPEGSPSDLNPQGSPSDLNPQGSSSDVDPQGSSSDLNQQGSSSDSTQQESNNDLNQPDVKSEEKPPGSGQVEPDTASSADPPATELPPGEDESSDPVVVDADQSLTPDDTQPPQPDLTRPNTSLQPPDIETSTGLPPAPPVDEEEEIQAPAQTDDNLPSFDEWKQKMLAEQAAEHEKTKSLDEPATSTTSQSKTKPGGKKVNYASATCGAKVRGTNNEAQSPSFILSENKDQYMINPCKAKKWFVVELCTPVQIQTLEIGNLELFSSLPESFIVHVSENYPTKDWKALGTFHARDIRSVQSFTVEGEHMYAHYIKVEMLSHYGTEHYCPLTVVRAYGLTVIEADDDENDEVTNSESTEEMADPNAKRDDEHEDTLFASAKDTVISLVKTVLSRDDDDEGKPSEDNKTDSDKPANTSSQGATGQTEERQTQPIAPETQTQQKDSEPSQELRGRPSPKAPYVTVDKTYHEDTKEELKNFEVPDPDVNQQPPDIVTLIKSPRTWTRDLFLDCQFCTNDLLMSCNLNTHTLCGYYRLWKFVLPTCCIDPKRPLKAGTAKREGIPGGKSLNEPYTQLESSQDPDQDLPLSQDSLESSEPVKIQPTPTQKTTETLSTNEKLQAEDPTQVISASETDPGQVSISGSGQAEVKVTESKQVVEPTDTLEPQAPASKDLCTEERKPVDPGCLVGPDVVVPDINIQPTPTNEQGSATQQEVNPDSSQPREQDSSNDKQDMKAEENTETADASKEHLNETNNLKNIYAQDPADDDLNLEMVPPPTGDEVQYHKLISSRKETTFMKLKNKIKELELNLNLSSRYLEELSQRYRKQMEDMYTSLNKTITKLTNTSRKAEERDLKQQEHIANLRSQIDVLNSSMSVLRENIQSTHMEVIERHLYLMVIEAFVFLTVLAWCLHRQDRHQRYFQALQRAPHTQTNGLSHGAGLVTPRRGVISPGHKRRNSTDATPTRDRSSSSSLIMAKQSYDDLELRKSGSANDVRKLAPCNLGARDQFSGQWEISKKKKKKKTSSAQKSLPFGKLVGHTLPSTTVDLSCQNSAHYSLAFDRGTYTSTLNPWVQSSTSNKSLTTSNRGSTTSNKCVTTSNRSLATSKSQGNIGLRTNGKTSDTELREHRRNTSDGGGRSWSADHVTNRSSSQGILHRKMPSYEQNMYSSLINGVNNDSTNGYSPACNGHDDDLDLTSKYYSGKYQGRKK